MGRKKFGWRDAINIATQAAGVAANVHSLQAGVNKAAAEAGKAGKAGKAATDTAKAGTSKIGDGSKHLEAARQKVDERAFKGSFADQRPAAEGGISKAPTLRSAQQNTGQSALKKAYRDRT